MKRVILLSALLTAGNAYADSSRVNSGSSMTLGPSSNGYSLSSASYNPAMGSFVLRDTESIRMAYFPTFGFNLELGQVDNFVDDLEDLADILDDPSKSNDPNATLEKFNDILPTIGQEGYLKTNFSFNAPLLPLYFESKTLGGVIGVDLSIQAQGGISILDDELALDSQNGTFSTNTAVYLKSGVETTLSLSYSRKVLQSSYGQLYAGGKFKYMNMQLSKQLIPLVELAEDDIGDLVSDRFDENQVSSSDFGIDLGLVWDAKNYRLGLTAENINSPEFEYGAVGVDCQQFDENTANISNCFATKQFVTQGRINSHEVHTKHALLRADALFKLTERLQFSVAADLAEYDDIIGYDNKWVHAAFSYDSDWLLLPSVRFGYHANQVGSETSSATVGFDLFKIVSLDLEYGLESIEVDDSEAPRRIGFSLSVQESF